jgi:DnaK suppressor protein
MPAKKAARSGKPAAKAAPRKAATPRKAAAPHKAAAPRKAAKSVPRARGAKPSMPKAKVAVTPSRGTKPAIQAPATREVVIARPRPTVPPAQVAEARPSLASLQARNARRQGAGDDDEDGTGSHNLLLGPRNVRPYRERKGEMYMGREQLEHFRRILNSWKQDLMEEVDRTMSHMKDEAANPPDPNDRATLESEFALELRTRDRERKLIRKIEEALSRIEDGSYGYCNETGEPIGVKRLEARPVATLSLEAQERRERREKQYGDRDDWYR